MGAGTGKVKKSYKIDNLFLLRLLFIVKYFSKVPKVLLLERRKKTAVPQDGRPFS
jgi:hypothetical protein